MEEAKLYPFLHKKHATLAPKLAAVLKDMKKEGTIEKFMKAVENSIDIPLQ